MHNEAIVSSSRIQVFPGTIHAGIGNLKVSPGLNIDGVFTLSSKQGSFVSVDGENFLCKREGQGGKWGDGDVDRSITGSDICYRNV